MSEIFEPNSNFDFDKLILNKPTQISGNYFIKFSVDKQPLYIQTPKASIKQTIIHKTTKKSYCDLLFSQDNDEFIQWMETLESNCQKIIFDNRKTWFETELDLDDIESSFTPPIKSYKSGTYHIVRTNMTPRLGKIITKVYDESETDLKIEDISGNMSVIGILEIQGIKCSSKSFQIDIELKQMMVLNPVDLFEKCIVNKYPIRSSYESINKISTPINEDSKKITNNENYDDTLVNNSEVSDLGKELQEEEEELQQPLQEEVLEEQNRKQLEDESIQETIIKNNNNENELLEIDFDLAEIPDNETIKIKERNDVYYKMYLEARKKAKIAKDLALSAYLEAKDIKNKYMLDDISDSDSSDFEEEEDSDTN